ncbi:hypothetical protein, partial [Escherichia coli]|uniref:hypothetical protein n=1 Tax=Escherichia coli TaxID=562 RepID=UPI0032DB98D6
MQELFLHCCLDMRWVKAGSQAVLEHLPAKAGLLPHRRAAVDPPQISFLLQVEAGHLDLTSWWALHHLKDLVESPDPSLQ